MSGRKIFYQRKLKDLFIQFDDMKVRIIVIILYYMKKKSMLFFFVFKYVLVLDFTSLNSKKNYQYYLESEENPLKEGMKLIDEFIWSNIMVTVGQLGDRSELSFSELGWEGLKCFGLEKKGLDWLVERSKDFELLRTFVREQFRVFSGQAFLFSCFCQNYVVESLIEGSSMEL